jgi:hypothetical protein
VKKFLLNENVKKFFLNKNRVASIWPLYIFKVLEQVVIGAWHVVKNMMVEKFLLSKKVKKFLLNKS